MEYNLPEPDLSRLEDLDLTPDHRNKNRRWEAFLAGFLLVPLLLYGGWDWLQHDMSARAYHQGVAAQAAQHWDAAQTAFAAAGTYEDAPARLLNASRQAQFLADTYSHFAAAQQQGNWRVAWNLAASIVAVQPDYRDIATQAPEARRALFAHGTAGTLYLESQGSMPGLYLLGDDGLPTYLPDTTADSRVLAVAAGAGRFVYTVERLPAGAADDNVCQPGAERLPAPQAQPRVAVTTLAPGAAPQTVILPAAFDPASSYWLTAHGLWGTGTDGRLYYYDLADNTLAAGRTLPAGSRAIGPAGAEGLVVATTVANAGGSLETRLIRLTPDGGAAQAGPVPGFLLTAQTSPDGQYVAFLIEDVQGGISRTLYVTDFPADPVAAAAPTAVDKIAWTGVALAARLQATFLPGTPTPAMLVEHQDDSGATVWRYTLPLHSDTLLWAGADTVQRDDHSGISPDGAALAFRTDLAGRSYVAWVPARPDSPPVVLPIDIVRSQMVDAWFAPRGDFLVYRVRNPEGLDKGTIENLWSLAVPPDSATPRLLGIARRLYDPAFPTVAFPAAGALAVYITPDGRLQARTLDGAADQVLAAGVDGVWAIGSAQQAASGGQ